MKKIESITVYQPSETTSQYLVVTIVRNDYLIRSVLVTEWTDALNLIELINPPEVRVDTSRL